MLALEQNRTPIINGRIVISVIVFCGVDGQPTRTERIEGLLYKCQPKFDASQMFESTN